MAARGDAFIGTIARFAALELVDVLADQVALDAVAGQEAQGLLHDVQLAQAGKLVEHHQQAVPVARHGTPVLEADAVGQLAHDHVDQHAHQRAQARLVRWLRDDVQAHGAVVVHQVADAEFRAAHVARDDRVAVQRQVGLGRRQHGTGLLLGPVEHVARGRTHHRMIASVGMAVGDHFHPQFADAAVRVRHHGVDHGQGGRRAFGTRLVQRMQDHAHDQRLAGLLPVRLQPLAVRVNDQGGEILHVAHLVLRIEADLVERIPAHAALGGGRLEVQHLVSRMLLAPARGQRPQLAFQVGDDGAVRPREQGRHHQADTLAGAGGRVRQHVFRPVVAQVVLPARPVQPGPHVHAGAGRLDPSGQQLP